MPALTMILASVLATSVPAPPPPACTAAEHHQFDFWIGQWDVWGGSDGQTLRARRPDGRTLTLATRTAGLNAVRFAPDGASVTVRNGTPWTLRSFSVRGPQGASFWRGTAPLAPGAEVRLSESVAESLVEADPTEPVDVSHSRRARS